MNLMVISFRCLVTNLVCMLVLLCITPSISFATDYYAPWENGTTMYCNQGNDDTPSHQGTYTKYGWDFIKASGTAGTPIYSAAAGTICKYHTTCPGAHEWDEVNKVYKPCGTSCGGWGNYIVIDHGDGTYTRYAHMQPGSITKTEGRVERAIIIGKMGTSGNSSGAHLHYQVENSTGVAQPSTIKDIGIPVYDRDQIHPLVSTNSIDPPPPTTEIYVQYGVDNLLTVLQTILTGGTIYFKGNWPEAPLTLDPGGKTVTIKPAPGVASVTIGQ